MGYLKLAIEPIPRSSAMASLAKLLPRPEWDRIRRSVYRRADYRCQICGKDARLHCHEVWHCNSKTGWQWLMGFRALCGDCHRVKHILSVRDRERFLRLARHFMQVNKVGPGEFQEHLQLARSVQAERNGRQWRIGFGKYAFQVPVLRNKAERRRYSEIEQPRYR